MLFSYASNMKLTTVTPYWGRPEILRRWLRSINQATTVECKHVIQFIGEHVPNWFQEESLPNMIVVDYSDDVPGVRSIGYYHDLGFSRTDTEWVMKLDSDCLVNPEYFKHLLPILDQAEPRQWFNGGMFYLNERQTLFYGSYLDRGLSWELYCQVMTNRPSFAAGSYLLPAATNFICRREEYLKLGGACPSFQGYGWEDYQQIYMLESNYCQSDPLKGAFVNRSTVTGLCRDLSRRKARELWEQDEALCLLHHWHPVSLDPTYRSSDKLTYNREVLLNYVLEQKRKRNECQ